MGNWHRVGWGDLCAGSENLKIKVSESQFFSVPTRSMRKSRCRRICHLELVYCFNNELLLDPTGNIPPAYFEEAFSRQQGGSAMLA